MTALFEKLSFIINILTVNSLNKYSNSVKRDWPVLLFPQRLRKAQQGEMFTNPKARNFVEITMSNREYMGK